MKMFMLSCALLWASPAFADDDEPASKGHEETSEQKPGGKFSLLGTECKAEEDEGLETTPGSPPLDVDDPGTPGCNGWEINIVGSAEFGKGMDGETPLFDINYGIGDNIQLKGEIPYLLSRIDGESTSGFGRAEFGIKYRFYDDESRGLTVAVYPQLEFAIPGTAAAEGEEGTGTLTKLPLLVSTKLAETGKGDVMLTANVGYNISTEPGMENFLAGAVGVGFPLMAKLAVMVEVSTEQAMTKTMEDVRDSIFKANLGFAGPISEHMAWFGAIGQSYSSSDTEDSNHTCVVLGFRILAGGP